MDTDRGFEQYLKDTLKPQVSSNPDFKKNLLTNITKDAEKPRLTWAMGLVLAMTIGIISAITVSNRNQQPSHFDDIETLLADIDAIETEINIPQETEVDTILQP